MKYLSFGAGVNSTALMLLLLDEGVDFESVFVDTGCEWPETYEHLHRLEEEGYEITWIRPEVSGTHTLYEYMMKYKFIPAWRRRFCTAKWKRTPFDRYVETPCTTYIGYDFEERRRRHLRDRKGIHFEYPLIERMITRERCVKIIRDHGLPVPPKSGCWLCPFQDLAGWKRLRDTYPELFRRARDLEDMSPWGFTFRRGMRLSSIHQDTTLEDFMEEGGE
ncbi:MAG: hypothetical protein CEE41_04400 [Hadesarchaea archaeon B3_Hades]|nr:MAG: hypothetical protein CEE41_04400 [Hadesarchaea archaeon B3_Hades]